MAMSKKSMFIIGGGVAVIIGLAMAKKKILAALDTAQAVNIATNAAAGAPEAPVAATPINGLAAYVSSPAYQGVGYYGLGDAAPVTSALTTVSTVVGQSVTTLTGLITLAMGYYALKEKKIAVSKAV